MSKVEQDMEQKSSRRRRNEIGATVHRGIHVQRMRGGHHDTTVRELIVDDRGVSVGGPLPTAGGRPPTPL